MNVRLFVVFTVVLLLAVNTALVLGIPCSSNAAQGFKPGWDLCPTFTNRNCDIGGSSWKKEPIWLIESYPTYDTKNKAPYGSSYYRLSSKGESYRNPHLPDPIVRSFETEMIEESGAACGGVTYTSSYGYFSEDRAMNDDTFIDRGTEPHLCYKFRTCDWKDAGYRYGWRREIANKGLNNEYEHFVECNMDAYVCIPDSYCGKKYEFYVVYCDNEDDL